MCVQGAVKGSQGSGCDQATQDSRRGSRTRSNPVRCCAATPGQRLTKQHIHRGYNGAETTTVGPHDLAACYCNLPKCYNSQTSSVAFTSSRSAWTSRGQEGGYSATPYTDRWPSLRHCGQQCYSVCNSSARQRIDKSLVFTEAEYMQHHHHAVNTLVHAPPSQYVR